jgi:hypothetical protein
MELVPFCSQTNPLSNHLASNSRDASTSWVTSAVRMDMLALAATWQPPICPPASGPLLVPHCCLPAPMLFIRQNLQTSCTTISRCTISMEAGNSNTNYTLFLLSHITRIIYVKHYSFLQFPHGLQLLLGINWDGMFSPWRKTIRIWQHPSLTRDVNP